MLTMMNELRQGAAMTSGVTVRTVFQSVHGLACGLVAALAMSALSAWAMPTEAEINQVRPLVKEIMAEYSNAYKANKKTAKEVGDAAAGHVNDAESEAAKYLLLRGAVNYYSIARAFDKAADVLEDMQSQIKELPASEVESLAVKALNRAGRNEAQRIREIRRVASIRAKAEREIDTFKSALRKNAGDTAALRGLADAYVRADNWPKALDVFAKLGIVAAAFELNRSAPPDFNSLKAADFWWDFKANDTAPYRAHAVKLYRRAMNEGRARGLMKTLVERRIAEVEAAAKMAAVPVSGATGGTGFQSVHGSNGQNGSSPSGKLYCVIDISGGPSAFKYPVSYLDAIPKGGWSKEYKTKKLVLRRIDPGTFIMGKDQNDQSHKVTISKPFYIGVFEVTQMQYKHITGKSPSEYKGEMRPVEHVSYDMIRGTSKGAQWPASSEVDKDSVIGRLRAKTRIATFDLPTEAQWEYACRAGTTSDYNNGGNTNEDLKQVARWKQTDGHKRKHATVGIYMPNRWSLYDMHGNVRELCLNWTGPLSFGTDPKGETTASQRVCRGGNWSNGDPSKLSSFGRETVYPSKGGGFTGFRLAIQPEE